MNNSKTSETINSMNTEGDIAMKTHRQMGMALVISLIAASALGCATMQGAQGLGGDPAIAAPQPAASPGEAPEPPSAAPQTASPAPKTSAECVALAAKPAAGQVSSASDPQKQLDEVFLAHHETFRCCVDALSAPKAGTDANMALVVTLDSAGKLTSSDILLSETSVQAPEVQACVTDVAKALAYPKPGNDMDVRYKRVFHFKARR